jgi:hypothetical protein
MGTAAQVAPLAAGVIAAAADRAVEPSPGLGGGAALADSGGLAGATCSGSRQASEWTWLAGGYDPADIVIPDR